MVPDLFVSPKPSEEKEVSLVASLNGPPMLPILENFSSFTRLKRVIAWVFWSAIVEIRVAQLESS